MEISEIISRLGLEASPKGEAVVVDSTPEDFARAANDLGLPLALMYATEEKSGHAVSAVFRTGSAVPYVTLRAKLGRGMSSYPSLTKSVMAAHWYERLMGDQFGLVAEGHPDWRRLVHHENIPAGTHPLAKDFARDTELAHADEEYPMHRVEGKGVYEIPVGPIHAGIIEPGHFRFNVIGERVITLEGKLFFKHKGVEKLLEGKNPQEAMPMVERISGDMAVGHSLAFCQAVESALGAAIPDRASALRVILGEWERITMHFHDISNIGGNGTALTFFWAQGSRLVERCRRLSDKIFGHRFLRGNVIPGGVSSDLGAEAVKLITEEAQYLLRELNGLEKAARDSDSFMERLETTGKLKSQAASDYGAVGLPARASGISCDVRKHAPYAAYGRLNVQECLGDEGDVAERFFLRFEEIRESIRIIKSVIADLPAGSLRVDLPKKAGSSLGYAESWRGEVLDWVRLDKDGTIDRCVIRDPSFCNWPLFGELVPGNIVPDFPICNKSLNLSYSGNDL